MNLHALMQTYADRPAPTAAEIDAVKAQFEAASVTVDTLIARQKAFHA